ncbi:hypothetical protein KKF91_08980 [Myxococcota bacterium]|nr:hypothetical protein [Myxococcota bacterium]
MSAALLLTLVLTSPPAWDDLSGLRAAAIEASAGLNEGGDLGGLSGAAAMMIIGAAPLPDPGPILRAVEAGGRLLLLTEAPSPLLRALGLRVEAAPEAASPRHPALFIARPTSAAHGGPLSGSAPLLANHAVALQATIDGAATEAAARLRLDNDRPFGYHLRLGEGEVWVLGDSSLFIDLMLRHPPNRAAMLALLDWLTRPRVERARAAPRRALWLWTASAPPLAAPPEIPSRRAQLNAALRRLNARLHLIEAPPLVGLTLGLALAVTALLLLRAPRLRPRLSRPSSAAARRGGPPPNGSR